MPGPILLYRASNVNDYRRIFFFFCPCASKTGSNCATIGCNLSKKHKLTLYETQSGEHNYVDPNFLNILPGATSTTT